MPGLCPFCLVPQLNQYHSLLCSDCVEQECALIRNSVRESGRQNAAASHKINDIFELCHLLQTGKLALALPDDPQVPNPSIKLIKNLAYRLSKLHTINTRAKIRNVHRASNAVRTSIDQLETELKTLESQAAPLLLRSLQTTYDQTCKTVENQLRQLRDEKMLQVERQAILLQRLQYFSLVNLVSLGTMGGAATVRKNQKLPTFYAQPVLKLKALFDHNSKVLRINEFFENLIKFQAHLRDVFRPDGVELPYLAELMLLLPDELLFHSIQDQQDLLLQDAEPGQDADSVPRTSPAPAENPERLLRMNEVFKLPLSSKTLNLQRRAKEEKAERSSEPNGEKAQTDKRRAPQQGAIGQSVDSGDQKHLGRGLQGKSIVIVPHKILLKPFTRLSTQEYLRFLLIVAKVITNFLVFFESTINRVPAARSQVFNARDKEKDQYDFSALLTRLLALAPYFEYKLGRLKSDSGEYSGSQSLASTFSNISDTSSIFPLTNHLTLKRSGPRGLFGRFFGDNEPSIDTEADVYGRVSESVLTGTSDSSKSVPDSQIPDLKTIMQAVYRIMVSGASGKTGNFSTTTYSMMAESKEQLDDWNVVSQFGSVR